MNLSEPGLFFKDNNGDLFKVGPVTVNATGAGPNAAPAGKSGNSVGEQWLDGRAAFASSVMKVFNGTSWVSSNGFVVDDTTGDFTLSKHLTVNTLIAEGVGADGYIRVPVGPTTDQNLITAVAGMIRFDTTLNQFRFYNGTVWTSISDLAGSLIPNVDNVYDMGSATFRWANVYTGDLHLQNDRGDWTMIEEETYLSLRNNKTGKIYKIQMEEVSS